MASLAACAGVTDRAVEIPADVPSRAAIDGVPLVLQEDFYCGPAALSMVLAWAGRDVPQHEIAAQAFSPSAQGSFRADMIGAARRQGQLVTPVSDFGSLLAEVAAGNPVIVFQNLSLPVLPRWHYAVVVGFDRARQEVVLHSGELEVMRMPFLVFRRTWARGENWAITVLPPGRLPATADEAETLAATVALEDTGQSRAAAAAYAAGAARWPDAWLWPFGLGNARYAMGDLAGAEDAFRRARRLAPDIPEIAANLTQVQRERAR